MDIMDVIVAKYNYGFYIILMMIGFYALVAKKNLVKKIIGMNIFQTAIILFFISSAYKKHGATLPIIGHAHAHAEPVIDPAAYINPLPHVLMLTAIVVMVATLGVALAIVIRIYRRYQTLQEDEIIEAME